MTQQTLRELAKQGNVKAIALLLQVGLQTQRLTVKADIQKGCLLLFLESDQIPEEQASVNFIHQNLINLGLNLFHSVKIYGRRRGSEEQAWNYEFEIQAKNNSYLPIGCHLRRAKSPDQPEIKELVLKYNSELELQNQKATNKFLAVILVAGVPILIYFGFRAISLVMETFKEVNLESILIFIGLVIPFVISYIYLRTFLYFPDFDISHIWVIEYDKKIVAFGELKKFNELLHIHKLFVTLNWRRRGLGSILVKHFMEETNQPIYVITYPQLANFYTRLGFVPLHSSQAIITLVYK